MKKLIIVIAALCSCIALSAESRVQPEHTARAKEIVSQMTLQEKAEYIGGYESWFIRAMPRFNLPAVRTADGPQGVRNGAVKESTLFPSGITVTSAWNPELWNKMGIGLGQDSRARGVQILLGPGVNIFRSPLCGRNFEYFGEDPYLCSQVAVNYIKGVQSQNVMACIKHYAVNNQEFYRHVSSSDIDRRTMHEIYLPAFEKAVKDADVASIMCSYNLVNSVHASENAYLLKDVARGEFGFKGIMMSDWTSTYSPLNAAQNGLDLEMPLPKCMKPEILVSLVEQGVLDERYIDEKCVNIIQTILAWGWDDPSYKAQDESISLDNPYSDAVSLDIAREAVTLLQNNDNFLPKAKGKWVICGPHADMIVTGGGSGNVFPLRTCTLAQGIGQMKGVKATIMAGNAFNEEDAAAVGKADVVVVCLGFDRASEKEGSDRSFTLPRDQLDYLDAVLQHSSNVVVVLNGGGAMEIAAWKDRVNAIVMAWYPGQQGGLAIAEVLTGKVNPSGKTPCTWGARLEDYPACYTENVDRIRTSKTTNEPQKHNPYMRIQYNEGVFVGYRGFDKNGVAPLYPFGYGLSYTSFEYSSISVTPVEGGYEVAFDVKNTGKRDGAEVAQVYVHPCNAGVPRPEKELKGFVKVNLAKGKTEHVVVKLDAADAFRHFENFVDKWVVDPGKYEIWVGASSQDIRLKAEVTL